MVIVVDQTELTDEQLAAEAAREGSDGPAFTALLRRHRERVWRICYRLMGNEHDAGDAAQEVFVRLFLGRAKFAGRSKYATWMHGVAVRTLPQVLGTFLESVLHLITYSLTGRTRSVRDDTPPTP